MKLIFTCGGTAGHINPAIAVANLMKERHSDVEILFIGAKGHMEEKLVPNEGYELRCLPGAGLSRGKNLEAIKKNAHALKCTLEATSMCKKIIREFQPDVIIGTGGYASFPALYEGAKMGIPTCVHESNALPGLTTRMAAKHASRVLVAFQESVRYYDHPEKVEVVGMPVRKEFICESREEARQKMNLGDRPLVVSAFGSLGAKVMNETMAELFRLEQEAGVPYRHIHATGSFGWEWMPRLVAEKGVDLGKTEEIEMRQYIYNMPDLMAAADVMISRSGAATCNEIGAAGVPSILIPSPNVTNNHQEKNARVLSDRGAAVLIPESECTAQKLFDEIQGMMADKTRRENMRATLHELVRLDSAERICAIIEELAEK